MPSRFIAHPDPRALIAWLRNDLEARRARDPLARLSVLAPNRRLAGMLRRQLTAGGRGYLGVRVLDLWALVSEIGAQEPRTEPPARLAPEVLLRHELQGCLVRAGGRFGRLAPGRPGIAGSLLATFQELREAEVAGNDISRLLAEHGSEPAVETLRVYARYLESLRGLERAGWLDRAGIVQRSIARAESWAGAIAAVYLYGAYELIGIYLSLLRALARATSVTFLLPFDLDGGAWEYGREFARRFLGAGAPRIERLACPAQAVGPRAVRLLYEEGAPAEAQLHEQAFELVHTQGVEAELVAVARRILDLRARDVPLSEIGVVARTLAPYAAHLAQVFDAHAIPFSTTATQPLVRSPAVIALLGLVRVLSRGFERRDLLALLGSPLARCPEGKRPRPDLLERWSGEAGIERGFAGWTEDLAAWVKHSIDTQARRCTGAEQEREAFRRRATQALADQMAILEALGREADAWRRCSGWVERADFIEAVAGRWIESFGPQAGADAAVGEVRRLLEELRAAGSVGRGAPKAIEPLDALKALEGALEAARLPLRDLDRDGVQVLDGMQARGHVFRALFLIGFNAGMFPMRLGEDPFLPERWRAELRNRYGRPVPLRVNLAEEHQLLALWVASVRDRLVITYRRADEQGRTEVASFALREVARMRLGLPDPAQLSEQATRIPVHPVQRIREWARQSGLVAPDEAALLVALAPGNRAARLRVHLTERSRCDTAMEAALAWMQERGDRWSAGEGRTGVIPESSLPERWSASRLEELASCPLRFFFDQILGVGALPEPPGEGSFDPLDWGARVHAVLLELYGRLRAEGFLDAADPLTEMEERRCAGLLEQAWSGVFEDLGRRRSRRLPVLWEEHARGWRQALTAFVLRDLRAWRSRRLSLVGLEWEEAAPLAASSPGSRPELTLRGRLDRVARDPEGRIFIHDYKTGSSLDRFRDHKNMLRGLQLQAPIYSWLQQERDRALPAQAVQVEFLGVGPLHGNEPEEATVALEGQVLEGLRAGLEETIRVLAGMAASGRFPFRHEERGCSRCDFEAACHHRERAARLAVQNHPDHADFFDVHRKTLAAPVLADVRTGRKKRKEP
ncbi:MAG: PD-(D/E)XK nuclease family protein [Acidobacteriota bacterium]